TGNVNRRGMACGGKPHPTPAISEPRSRHGEIKTILPDTMEDEIMEVVQEISWIAGLFKSVQRFGVDTIGHQSRDNPVSGDVANEHVQEFVGLWQNNAEVSPNGMSGTVVSLHGQVLPR